MHKNYNEIIYLYCETANKKAYDLLNSLYFGVIFWNIKKFYYYRSLFLDEGDLLSTGYWHFIQGVKKFNYLQNKDFINWISWYIIYRLKNYFRKHFLNKKTILNYACQLGTINTSYLKTNACDFQHNNDFVAQEKWCIEDLKKTILNHLILNHKNQLFKIIFNLRKKGFKCREISLILNKSYKEIKNCWDYNFKKLKTQAIRQLKVKITQAGLIYN